jgi:GntR family transcriptional regulator
MRLPGTYGLPVVMQIVVDIEDPNPPFAQLIEQIKQAVSSGQLGPGDPLPSIRQLANDLELNNKTVAKAYRLLERDSVIQSRGYRGTFVHPDGRANSAVDLNVWVVEQLQETISAFRKAGVTDPEINNAFRNVMNEQNN